MTSSQISLPAPAWPAASLSLAEADELTIVEWAGLLDVSSAALYKRQPAQHAGMRSVNGGIPTRTYTLAQLPADYQERLRDLLHRSNCPSFADLLAFRLRNDTRFQPDGEFASKTANQKQAALWRQEVMRIYFALLAAGEAPGKANRRACQQWEACFGERCNEKTIRRWANKIDACGGIELAPLEAFADNKNVPHPGARVENRGLVPPAVIKEFRALCCKPGMEHMMGAYRQIEILWLNGHEFEGVPVNTAPPGHVNAKFPVPFHRLRKFAPPTAVRRKGSHGNARARREALPFMRITRAFMRFGAEYIADDSRADIIAIDEDTGEPVELRFYISMEGASKKIVALVMRQTIVGASGAIRASDVDALIGRTLHAGGMAPTGCLFKLERGAVACTPARQSLLEGQFPGVLKISRTGMDGGSNHPGLQQEASGHWMGKGVIESFMRTLSFFLQHISGQRGGTYVRQPAHLGLRGRRDDHGLLEYSTGSQIHESALRHYGDRAMQALKIDEAALAEIPLEVVRGRYKLRTLLPVSWAKDAILQAIAYYNGTPNHRREGYLQVEQQLPDGTLDKRMESANERAARLFAQAPTIRISDADLSIMLTHAARRVTVGKNGVNISINEVPGWQFWSENSIACAEAARLATCKKDFVALIDLDAFATWDGISPLSIHLLSDSPANWKPGQPGRYLESLPLVVAPSREDPEAMAKQLAAQKRVENRLDAALIRATMPLLKAEMAASTARGRPHEGAISLITQRPTEAPVSALALEITEKIAAQRQAAQPHQTRAEQKQNAQERYFARLAGLSTQPVSDSDSADSNPDSTPA